MTGPNPSSSRLAPSWVDETLFWVSPTSLSEVSVSCWGFSSPLRSSSSPGMSMLPSVSARNMVLRYTKDPRLTADQTMQETGGSFLPELELGPACHRHRDGPCSPRWRWCMNDGAPAAHDQLSVSFFRASGCSARFGCSRARRSDGMLVQSTTFDFARPTTSLMPR